MPTICPPLAAPATPVVANLRETTRQLAAAKRRHPAGKQAPTKAPAKKAAPKAAAKPAAGSKLKWSFPDGFENRAKTGQSAVANGREYQIAPNGEKWKATVKQGGKTTVLVEAGSFGAAYNAITKRNKEAS